MFYRTTNSYLSLKKLFRSLFMMLRQRMWRSSSVCTYCKCLNTPQESDRSLIELFYLIWYYLSVVRQHDFRSHDSINRDRIRAIKKSSYFSWRTFCELLANPPKSCELMIFFYQDPLSIILFSWTSMREVWVVIFKNAFICDFCEFHLKRV